MENLIERVARFADIDTRRVMGFLPRRLPPSDLAIRSGVVYSPFYTPWAFTRVDINENCNIIAAEDGEVSWRFGPENCYRDGKPLQVVEIQGGTLKYMNF